MEDAVPEVHSALHSDEELELELCLPVVVLEDALVVALLLLAALSHAQDDLVAGPPAARPDLVAGLHVQVFEALDLKN